MEPNQKQPASVALIALVVILFLSLFALEITDSIVFHHQVARSVFLFPPAAGLLWGVLNRRRWAWFLARILTLAGVLIFGATNLLALLSPHMKPRDLHGILVISTLLCLILIATFLALGRPGTKNHYRIGKNHEN
ncbi:MAG: hypothetical protein JF609_03060 [Verrucomicrobia bacterium]|nr:hypothetical protein [Verrucomicrobiota bacterium]